jgi:hypothetical protein
LRLLSCFIFVVIAFLNGKGQFVPNCQYIIHMPSTGGCQMVYAQLATNPSSQVPVNIILPNGATGLAIGPKFGFNAPDPTFWTTVAGYFYYWDGTAFQYTGHQSGGANPGGSKNYLYNLSGYSIYRYNGTGSASFVATYTDSNGGDVVGDDNDNFYLLSASPPALHLQNSSGTRLCSYSIASSVIPGPQSGFAINRDRLTILNSGGTSAMQGTLTQNGIEFSGSSVGMACGMQTDFASCASEARMNPPIAALYTSSLGCISGSAALITPFVPGSASYTWAGPGILGSVHNSSIAVLLPGVYSRTMISCSGLDDVKTFTVYPAGIYEPVLTAQSGTFKCFPDPAITLSVSGMNSFTWYPSSSLSSSNGLVVNANPSVTTIYTVEGSQGQCVGSSTIKIVASPPVIPNAVLSQYSVCAGTNVYFQADPALTLTWQPGNMTGNNFFIMQNQSNSYTVSGANYLGCTGTQTLQTIVYNYPTVTAVASATKVCAGESLTISSTGADSYVLMPGGLTGSVIPVTPGASTTFTLTGTKAICQHSKIIQVNVYSIPVINCAPTLSAVCPGETVALIASGGISHTFMPGSLVGNSPTVQPQTTTIYTVSGFDLNCVGINTVEVKVFSNPSLNLNMVPDMICRGETSTITVQGAASYFWQHGSANAEVVVRPIRDSIFVVDGYSTEGCKSTGNIIVRVQDCTALSESEGARFELFPNPASGILHLHTSVDVRDLKFEFYNTEGRLVKVTKSETSPVEISVADLAPGIYLVRIGFHNRAANSLRIVIE